MHFIVFSVSIVVLASSLSLTVYGISIDVKLKNESSNSSSSNLIKQQNVDNINSIHNSALQSINNNNLKGTLIVKIMVNNKGIGSKSPMDFKIDVHANDPFPSSFVGGSSGTNVSLGMGMYSINESSIPKYSSTYSPDCFGGIMSTGTKDCIIVNTYNNASLIANNLK
jgi:hypothetical protein